MYILVVDDNVSLQYTLKRVLEEAGYKVYDALSISDAEERVSERKYDLILLDWVLPDGSGVDFLKSLRDDGVSVPVMLFSSKNEVEDKVEALDTGADDYLEKPFSNIELLARVRALLRRESANKSNTLKIGPMEIDFKKRIVTVDGNEIALSTKEFELLEFMATNADTVLTRYQIQEHINRDFDRIASSNIVDAHIKNLRKKLGRSDLIETVRGVGYVIRKR
ncbi:MAG: response regulator transcription factor [Hydrogenimonas sp.]|nr:response regulator transcription factor [Hydrogenimonas sp.]